MKCPAIHGKVVKIHVNCYYQYYLIGRAKRAPHWGVQSRFRVIYIYICCRYVSYVKVGGVTWTKHAHAQSLLFLAVKPVTPVLFISYTLEL